MIVEQPVLELPALDPSSLAHDLRSLWPLGLLFSIVVAGRVATALWRGSRLRRSGIRQIDRMSHAAFQRRLGLLFLDLGYQVERVGGAAGEYGADLVVSKAGRRTAVNAKRRDRSIGVRAVQEALGARGYYDADDAIVVTNRSFTGPARELARRNGVRLYDRAALAHALRRAERPALEAARVRTASGLVAAVAGGAPQPVPAGGSRPGMVGDDAFCARCGEPVSAEVRDYCHSRRRFHGLVYCLGHQNAIG